MLVKREFQRAWCVPLYDLVGFSTHMSHVHWGWSTSLVDWLHSWPAHFLGSPSILLVSPVPEVSTVFGFTHTASCTALSRALCLVFQILLWNLAESLSEKNSCILHASKTRLQGQCQGLLFREAVTRSRRIGCSSHWMPETLGTVKWILENQFPRKPISNRGARNSSQKKD